MQIEKHQTAIKLLEEFTITKSLKHLGFSSDQLDQLDFHVKDRNLPLDERPLRVPAALLSGWDLTGASSPPIMSLLRDYVICKYALIVGPSTNGSYLGAAWQQVADTHCAQLVHDRLRYLERQRSHARMQRGLIPEIGMTIREFVIEYAKKPDNRESKPLELWESFGSHMGFHRLDPKRVGDRFEYAIDRSIKYRTFCNYVRKARKAH